MKAFARLPLVAAVLGVFLLGLGTWTAWRWLDTNLLGWGIHDGQTRLVNEAELLNRVHAFEIATVKHTYQTNARIEQDKALNAAGVKMDLPSWLAGQNLDVNARVVITAGTDLSQVKPEDMRVSRKDNSVVVTISVPSPQILSTEIVPNSLDIETGQGIMTRVTSRIGFSEKDLRDQAVDRLVTVAKQGALKNGVLAEAEQEVIQRLEGFLNALPTSGSVPVHYVVQVQPPHI